MTRDYAKPSTTRNSDKPKPKAKSGAKSRTIPKAKSNSPGKTGSGPTRRAKPVVMLVILLAVFLYALYYLQTIPPTPAISEATPSSSTDAPDTTAKPSPEKHPESQQRFKFYDILPESEVVPPKVDAYHYKEKNQKDNYYYLVQTGSFRKMQDAERQKATIAFQGLKANIKTVENSDGSIWYRVMTGPFYDRSQMNSALDKLVSINIEPLVKKLKADK